MRADALATCAGPHPPPSPPLPTLPAHAPLQEGYYSFADSVGGNANSTALNADLRVVTELGRWLAQDPPEPFAVWISGVGAHPPYGAPKVS